MTEAENPPAFPCSEFRNTSSDPFATPREFNHIGLTLRDYFAGQALAGLLALGSTEAIAVDDDDFDAVACDAYSYADAMLLARQQQAGDAK